MRHASVPVSLLRLVATALLAACDAGGATSAEGTTGATGDLTSASGVATASGTGGQGTTSSGAGGGGAGGGLAAGFVYSPYKDVGIDMNWNTNVISSKVTGASSTAPLLGVIPAKLATVTWAFAAGECGAESWAGIGADALATANVQGFVDAGKSYILSTGGAAGSFTCGSDESFGAFLQRYDSPALLGVDFDIEAGQSAADIDALVKRVKYAQGAHPTLRWSFTLATLAPSLAGSTVAVSMGSDAPDPLGAAGQTTMSAIAANGLSGYLINLMVMDYGGASQSVCVVGANGRCDMGQSAIQAAMDLHDHYGVPYSQIELTPMIGGNDVVDEVFSLADADALSDFVKANGLAGLHFWSVDRDTDCALGYASPTCNSYGRAGTLGFTQRFLANLGY